MYVLHVSTNRTRLTRLMSRTSFFINLLLFFFFVLYSQSLNSLLSPTDRIPCAVHARHTVAAAAHTHALGYSPARTQTLVYNCTRCVTLRALCFMRNYRVHVPCLFRLREGSMGSHRSLSPSSFVFTCQTNVLHSRPTTTERAHCFRVTVLEYSFRVQ